MQLSTLHQNFILAKTLIDPLTNCWNWQGTLDSGGYGRMMVRGKCLRMHRLNFQRFCGELPAGLHVLHHCDNPGCINPAHLFLGTAADNMQDKVAKGRCRNGSNANIPGAYWPHPKSAPVMRSRRGQLSPEQREEVRRKYLKGDRTQTSLAAEYGVSVTQVHNVVHGKLL